MDVSRRADSVWGSSLLCLLALLLMPLACGSEESARLRLGDGCSLNSDCDAGLICAFGLCHVVCNDSKDCDGGRCVVDDRRLRVCQFAEAVTCSFNSECAQPLICGRDGACRNQCGNDRDCVPGQVCRHTTCAEPEELEDDGLPLSPRVEPIGSPCALSSDCPPGPDGEVLECRSNLCSYACFTTVDCERFYRCTTDQEPERPGDCMLIGPPGELFCDPAKDEPHPCVCTGGGSGVQVCAENGSKYEDCQC